MRKLDASSALIPRLNQSGRIPVYLAMLLFLVVVAGCGDAPAAASDPPGALVRLQRADNATSLPGDLTIFSTGALQLYIGNRGALRKQISPAELSDLQAALADPAINRLGDAYPATLPAGAGDILTIYGSQRRSI